MFDFVHWLSCHIGSLKSLFYFTHNKQYFFAIYELRLSENEIGISVTSRIQILSICGLDL